MHYFRPMEQQMVQPGQNHGPVVRELMVLLLQLGNI